MKKLFSKFKVIAPMLFCLMSFAMVGLVGCGEQVPKPEGHVHSITLSSEEQPATCVEQGHKAIYKCSGCDKKFLDAEGKTVSTNENSVIPIDTNNHDYNYDGITYSPVTADTYTGKWKATVTCKREGCTDETANHTLSCETTIDAKVKSEATVSATCKDNGSETYILTFSEEDKAKLHLSSNTVEQTVSTTVSSEHTYNYSDISYTFYDDHTKCTETVKCTVCGHECSYNSESYTTVVNSEANCTNNGKKTITFNFGNALAKALQQHSIEQSIPIDSSKHNCTSVQGQSATCTATGLKACYQCGWCHKYFDNQNGTGTSYDSQPTTPMSAHTYGTATYVFSNDNATCTAEVACSVCKDKKTFNASVTKTNEVAATCEKEGSYTLSAKFDDTDASVLNLTNNTYTKNITTGTLGHNYSIYSYNSTNRQWKQTCERNCGYTSIIDAGGSEGYPYLVTSSFELQEVIALGGYVRVENDFSITSQLKLTNRNSTSKTLILDLNGKTLTNNVFCSGVREGDLVCIDGYDLTVKNGKIEMSGTYGSANYNVFGVYGDWLSANTKLTLDSSLTVTNSCGASCVFIAGDKASLDTSANLSSTGDDSWHSAVIQGYGDDLDAKVNTVEIKGGTISNAKGVAIYIPNLGTYNISGGTIEGSTALYAKAGNITITGGTFTGQQTAISTYAYYSDGWIETGEAVVFDSCGYAGSNSNTFTATINSGTFGTAKGTTTTKAIGSYTRNGNQKVTVSGDAMSSNSDLVNYADYTVYVNDGYDTDSVGKKVYYFTSLNLKNNSDDCSLYVLSERAILVATYKEVTDNSSSKLYEISYTYNKTTENNSEKVAETFLVKVNNTNHTFEYVSNETYQCYVTSTSNTSKKVYYDTLQGAVNGSLSGESITLTGDIKLVGDSIDFIAQSTVKNLTLNLGGHSLKDSAVTKYNEIIYVQGYNLTVENGTIESDYNAIVFDVNLQQSKGMTATLTLRDNLIVKNNCAGNCVFMKGTGANLVTSARLYSSCSDDKISSNNKAVVQINGSKTTEGKGEYAIGSITVDGGEIVNSNGAEAMYLPNAGTFNINAGTIKGAGAIYAKCGILNIGTKNGTTQPTFISTKTDKTPYSFNGNGCNATGDVIVVDSCGYPAGVPTINVYGGTFKVVKNNGEVTPESLGLDSVAVYNNFKKSGNQKATVNNQSNSINVAVYDVVNSLETEVMGKVNANDTVVLYDNIDLGNGHIEINKKVTFDLNGKTLTGNGASGVFEVVYGGDLTITGNGYVVAKAGNGTTVGATTGTIWAMAVWAYGGKVTIENGSFSNQTCDGQKIGQGNSEQNTQTPDNLDLIYAKDDEKGNKSTIIIKGGTFNCVQKMWTLNIKNTSKSTIKVTGGTFIGFNPDSTDNGGALNSADVQATQKEYFTESGYKSQLVSGSNSNYEVVPNTTNSNSDNA